MTTITERVITYIRDHYPDFVVNDNNTIHTNLGCCRLKISDLESCCVSVECTDERYTLSLDDPCSISNDAIEKFRAGNGSIGGGSNSVWTMNRYDEEDYELDIWISGAGGDIHFNMNIPDHMAMGIASALIEAKKIQEELQVTFNL